MDSLTPSQPFLFSLPLSVFLHLLSINLFCILQSASSSASSCHWLICRIWYGRLSKHPLWMEIKVLRDKSSKNYERVCMRLSSNRSTVYGIYVHEFVPVRPEMFYLNTSYVLWTDEKKNPYHQHHIYIFSWLLADGKLCVEFHFCFCTHFRWV